jgi:hypothetical protein
VVDGVGYTHALGSHTLRHTYTENQYSLRMAKTDKLGTHTYTHTISTRKKDTRTALSSFFKSRHGHKISTTDNYCWMNCVFLRFPIKKNSGLVPGVTGETDTAVDRAVGDSGSQLSLLFCQNHQYGRTVATLPTRQISTYNPPTKPNWFYLIHPSLSNSIH